MTGVYKIQSLVNPNKLYVGSSVNIEKRIIDHKSRLFHNRHSNIKLQRYCNKYGSDVLVYSIIEECEKKDLIIREQYYIDTMNPWFNISPTAYSNLGSKRTEESKRRYSKAVKGRVMSEETRKKLSIINKGRPSPLKGKKMSDETKKKLSDSKRGKHVGSENHFYGHKHTEETKKKISNANKGRKSNLGKHLSDTTKDKIRQKHLGKKLSEEQRKHIAEGGRGRKHSEETKKKMSVWQIGKKLSEETKRKISEANKGKKRTEEARANMRKGHINKKVKSK